MMPPGKPMGPPKKGCIDLIITPVTCIFFAVNVIFFILGIAALALGGVALFDDNSLSAFSKLDETGALTDIKVAGFMKHLSIGMMAVGGGLLLIGFMGCFGVAVGISCFIYLYCIIFTLLVVAQLAGFGYLYLYKDALVVQLKNSLEDGVKTYHGVESDAASTTEKAMNLIQKQLQCCGVSGGADYKNSPWYKSSRRAAAQHVPVTCCKLKDKANLIPSDSLCQSSPIDDSNPYTSTGCLDALKAYIFTRGVIAVAISILIMILQLLAVCYAAILEKSFVDDDLAAKLMHGHA